MSSANPQTASFGSRNFRVDKIAAPLRHSVTDGFVTLTAAWAKRACIDLHAAAILRQPANA